MTEISKLKFGDVVQSPNFVNGHRHQKRGPVQVGYSGKTAERYQSGGGLGGMVAEENNACDPQRAVARFFILHIEQVGYPSPDEGGPLSLIPLSREYRILASRLTDDGSYAPEAEQISFGDSPTETAQDAISEVEVVGRMEMRFVSL